MAKKEPIVKETVQERETYWQVKRHYYIASENVEAPIGGGEGAAGCGVARFQFDSTEQLALSIRKDSRQSQLKGR